MAVSIVETCAITGGVDTHADMHVAAALDPVGGLLGVREFEDAEIIAGLLTRFDTLRNEALRGSESLALIERMCEEWKAAGARAATQATTAESA